MYFQSAKWTVLCTYYGFHKVSLRLEILIRRSWDKTVPANDVEIGAHVAHKSEPLRAEVAVGNDTESDTNEAQYLPLLTTLHLDLKLKKSRIVFSGDRFVRVTRSKTSTFPSQ